MSISNGSLTDANGDAITGQTSGTQTALDVGINVAGVQVDPRQIRALTSGDNVTVAASALPTGASTSANQSTANTSLASIDSKLTSPIQVVTTTAKGTLTDRSGTAQATSASIIAANANRRYLFIQNLSGSKMYINFGAAATVDTNSILLQPNGGSFTMEGEFLSTDQIFIIAAANNKPFMAKEA